MLMSSCKVVANCCSVTLCFAKVGRKASWVSTIFAAMLAVLTQSFVWRDNCKRTGNVPTFNTRNIVTHSLMLENCAPRLGSRNSFGQGSVTPVSQRLNLRTSIQNECGVESYSVRNMQTSCCNRLQRMTCRQSSFASCACVDAILLSCLVLHLLLWHLVTPTSLGQLLDIAYKVYLFPEHPLTTLFPVA